MATEIVDASKLDACCAAEANAIRAKTGSSAQIAYDWANSKGFADAIAAIPTGGGGYDYDIKRVNVTGNSPTVDRAFDNFVLIAEIEASSLPVAYPGNLRAFFLMFAYVNEQFIPQTSPKGFDVFTNGASEPFKGSAPNMNGTSVNATSITFTTYSSHNMYSGSNVYWNVLQIELPSDTEIYSFYDKSFS